MVYTLVWYTDDNGTVFHCHCFNTEAEADSHIEIMERTNSGCKSHKFDSNEDRNIFMRAYIDKEKEA